MSAATKRILFVCTGNTCRSPMAAALFRDLAAKAGLKVEVISAGVGAFAGAPASPGAKVAMRRYNLDLSAHQSQDLRHVTAQVDLVITMTRRHRDAVLRARPDLAGKVHVLKEYLGVTTNIDVIDPFGGDATVYEKCADELATLAGLLVAKLQKESR